MEQVSKFDIIKNERLKKFKRILFKFSGERLKGDQNFGHDFNIIKNIASEIAWVHNLGLEICLVVGGGNIYRGSNIDLYSNGMEKAAADYIGMLATVINALTIQNAIENLGIECRVMSAIPMQTICESYIRRRALRHMEKGRIVIFAAGTGNPFFTTDTAATLRAIEMGCDVLMKGTQVDGVYCSDPKINKNSKRYCNVSYNYVLQKNLSVMDSSAISLARDNKLPIIIFSLKDENPLQKLFDYNSLFTIIDDKNDLS
jgi:uridylate kinase